MVDSTIVKTELEGKEFKVWTPSASFPIMSIIKRFKLDDRLAHVYAHYVLKDILNPDDPAGYYEHYKAFYNVFEIFTGPEARFINNHFYNSLLKQRGLHDSYPYEFHP